MIDWASGWFPCSYDSEKLNSGLIASLLPTGEIEWITHKKTIVENKIAFIFLYMFIKIFYTFNSCTFQKRFQKNIEGINILIKF